MTWRKTRVKYVLPLKKVNWSDEALFAAGGDPFFVDRTTSKQHLRWLFYLLQSLNVDDPPKRGTTSGIKREELYNQKILVPPLAEQQLIANHLDRETAKLSTLSSSMEALLAYLLEKRRALISVAVRHGLNPNVAMRDSGVTWLGQIPAHWHITRIGILFRERNERNQPHLPRLKVSIHTGVTLHDARDDRYEQMAKEFSPYKVAYAGDIAFNRTRMWQGAVGIVPTDGKVSPEYIVAASIADIDTAYYGHLFACRAFSAEAARYSRGMTWDRYRLYWSEFRDIRVPLPPLDEQHQIVNHITDKTTKLDELHTSTKSTIGFLSERRKALIRAVISGEIRVTK